MAEVLIDTMGEDNMTRRAPLRRLGDDEGLKGLTVLLASDAGKHITVSGWPWTVVSAPFSG